MPGKTPSPFTSRRIYQRSGWNNTWRWVVFALLVFLNFMVFFPIISRHVMHPLAFNLHDLWLEFQISLFFLFIDFLALPYVFFEIKKAEISSEDIILSNLLFSSRLVYGEILSFTSPPLLPFSIVRTRHFFYLINKTDIPGYADLATNLAQRIGAGQQVK